MEYTEELTLIKTIPTLDDRGNTIYTETTTEVMAKKNFVGTKEYYNALAVGIVPTAELQIRLSNYDNETEVEYKGIRYSVIRTIPKQKYDIVLVIGIKQGING